MADPDDLVGQILLGKLEVVRKIGGGGMGVVYEVEHRLTGHRRALKVVLARYADRPRFMKRLLREAKVAGTLKTPYVVETFDAGRLEDGSAYVLMELLDGRTLYEVLQDEGRLPARRLAEIMAQLAEGMSVAHDAGIVHRDLKPENIFLVPDRDLGERVKILDFGVSKFDATSGDAPARLTVEGTLVGTPYYMSPEQAAGREVDARSDVYAMGVMMYEALTGRLPFEADTVGALFVKIGAGECVPLRIRRSDLDEKWCELVHKAFHRDPDQRFQSAELLRRDLVQLLEGGATAARAKTISDGARATLGYSQELPPPPKTPRETHAETREIEEEARALAPPPAPSSSRGLPAWAWAAAGAAIVLAIAIPWRLAEEDAPAEEPASMIERAADAPPVEHEEERTPTPLADAGLAAAPPPSEAEEAPAQSDEPRSPPRPTTKAHAAGLDPNPYRR